MPDQQHQSHPAPTSPPSGDAQGGRRPTGASPEGGSNEVVPKPLRRRFPADYKNSILQQADACKGPGEIGALLRREGLYSSSLTQWRRQRDQAGRKALNVSRGPKKRDVDPELLKENKLLRRENELLQRRLKRAELILDIQKKTSELLGIPLSPHPPNEFD